MVAFIPISPAAARHILHGISEADVGTILSDFVEAGLIRAYARVVETLTADGGRTEVRDAQIPRPLWKRIVAEEKVEHVLATGSVKLSGDGLVGGRPAVMITGVRFNEANLRDVASQHSPTLPIAAPATAPQKAKPAPKVSPKVAANLPLIEIMDTLPTPTATPAATVKPAAIVPAPVAATPRTRATLPEGDVMVSIADTMDILGVSRGTVGNLVKRGDLISKKLGTRTMIYAKSIRALLGVSGVLESA
ncbi:helix-turn-helix domain-containing protein [Sphingomonas sp. OK281]|uniref:helix-turn-helix domain-containing protein n=1 Tax=Sphingomonas sp. OK281 TaxID=1881067 RepID=UPI0008ECA0B6|nr:helix-turn-helix domain-containing protein [Sphingomonas sp. OK281]SFO02179.1 Helix-turn-helix domain-containing protein [Sphingomonas sp. OK281]